MPETHPEKRLIGYARVSTVGQTLDSQLEQLRAAGCSSRNIYREKVTGARAAYGPPPFLDTGPTERGQQTARAGRDVAGIGRQLRPQHIHHAPRHAGRMTIQ